MVEKELNEIKNEIYDIKTDIKLIVKTQEMLSKAVDELKETNKNLQIVITKQQSQSDDIHELFIKYNQLKDETAKQFAQCPAHAVKLKTLCSEIKELKETIKQRDRVLIGLVSSIAAYIIIQVLKVI